jgi:hypothetical protein
MAYEAESVHTESVFVALSRGISHYSPAMTVSEIFGCSFFIEGFWPFSIKKKTGQNFSKSAFKLHVVDF